MKSTKYTAALQRELDQCGKMPIFEIPVKCQKTGEPDYIVCEISFRGRSAVAQRDAVTPGERKSQYIAKTAIPVDQCFSLDEHLQELHSAVLDDILQGSLWELTE